MRTWYSHFTREQMALGMAAGLVWCAVLLDQTGILKELFSRLSLPRLKRKGRGITIGREWIPDSARLRHTHIVGATGTGKTVLIEKLLFEDLKRGYGAMVIDPKGERSFYESVRAYCRSIGREQDLFLLSATASEESSTWNPCALGNASELQTKFFNSAIYNEPHYAKACEEKLLNVVDGVSAQAAEASWC